MTKADIVELIANEYGFPKKESADLVESILKIIKDTLADGELVKVPGFGNFDVKEKGNHRGRNPLTGEEITIDAPKGADVQTSAMLKEAINKYR